MHYLLPTCHVSTDGSKREVLGIKLFVTSFFGVFAKFLKSEYYIRYMSVCLSVPPFGTTRPRNEGFSWNVTRITDTLHEGLSTFMIIPRSVLLRMRNISDKACRMVKNFSENLAVYDRMWKNMVEPERPQITYYGARTLRAG